MRFPLSLTPALGRKQSRALPFSYLVPVAGDTWFLEPRQWFPKFILHSGLFSKGEPRAANVELDIFVPAGDRALSTGRLRGVKKGVSGGETEFRYQLTKEDFDPFLLTGRYREQRVSSAGQHVIFWSLAPFDSACADSVASGLEATMRLYRSAFGPVWKHPPPIRLIQVTPASLAETRDEPTAGSVPAGVLFAYPPSRLCAEQAAFLSRADRELARTWFGWALRAEPGAEAVLGSGAVDYAALVAAQNRDPAARARQVAEWLAEYDRLRAKAKPLPPTALDRNSSRDQWRMGSIQSALCLVALEDRFGSGLVRKALAHLVRSLRGRPAGLNELRSAVEQETGQDLYVFFREWLRQAGIPASFRSRHPSAVAEEQASSIRAESRRTP